MSQNRVLNACYSFLVPVARFLLRNGVSFREFEELARTAFVQVAGDEYGIRGRSANVSRVATVTGVSRKEVRRIRDLIETYGVSPRIEISPLGDVLHHWYTDTDFLGGDGQPRALPQEGDGATFELLASRCSRDVPVSALKNELLRTGAVSLTPENYLVPTRRQAVPEDFGDKLVTSLAFNLYGLASTVAFNSNPQRAEAGRIERFIQSEHIPSSARALLREDLRHKIEQFSLDLDDTFSEVAEPAETNKKRLGVGIYYYEEDDEDAR